MVALHWGVFSHCGNLLLLFLCLLLALSSKDCARADWRSAQPCDDNFDAGGFPSHIDLVHYQRRACHSKSLLARFYGAYRPLLLLLTAATALSCDDLIESVFR